MTKIDDAIRNGADAARAPSGPWFFTVWGRIVAVLAMVGVVFYLSTFIQSVPDWLLEGIQPSGYPRGVLLAILLFTAIMLLEEKSDGADVPEEAPWLVYKTIAMMIVTLVISTYVDFFLGIVVFIAISIPMWGMRRWGFSFLYGVATAAVIYLVFATALGVRFPHGPITSLLP
jgi:hypothetical protein